MKLKRTMKLINTDDLTECKAGNFSPEMLVVGKGYILSAPDWSEEFKKLKLERDEARKLAEDGRLSRIPSNAIFPWDNDKD